MEFSTDPWTADANPLLASKPEFLDEFRGALLENKLESTFGLIATKEPSNPHFQFVEFSSERRSSVLKETLESEVEGKTLIQTSWCFTADETGMACAASCFSKCVQPASSGHYHEHSHAHNPNG